MIVMLDGGPLLIENLTVLGAGGGRRPVPIRANVGAPGVVTPRLPRVHHGGLVARPQVLLELLVCRTIVRLQSVVKDYIGVSTRAIRHVVESSGLFTGDGMVHRLVLKVVKGVPWLTALVITELVQTSICESYISIAT